MKTDNRTLAELEKAYLSDESVEEFDRIIRKSESRWRKPAIWSAVAAVAASFILMFWPKSDKCDFNAVEIAEGIRQIMNLDTETVKSVSAKPEGRLIILSVKMNDGSECFYVMSRDGKADAISITAME